MPNGWWCMSDVAEGSVSLNRFPRITNPPTQRCRSAVNLHIYGASSMCETTA